MRKFRNWLTPAWVKNWAAIYKEVGFKGLLKQKGWKVVAAFFLYYLIRDSILYLLIPYLIARGIISN